jgi:cell division protein ZapA
VSLKNKVEVRIGGKAYTLVGVEADEYIQRVALYIDRKMNEILRGNSNLSTSMVAVLTAINVADDYFKAHEKEVYFETEFKKAQAEIERLRDENKNISLENNALGTVNAKLQLELAKREAELSEVRNSMEKASRARLD